jgi:hypothetical protein
MARKSIELDIAGDQTRQAVREWAAKFNCTSKLLMEHGPAGGNPLYRFSGSSVNLDRLYRDLNCD